MTERQIRRAAERKARKAQNKQHSSIPPGAAPIPIQTAERETTPISEAQLAANRANAQFSTGPASPAGKEKVSQNRTTHGLTGAFRLLEWEDLAQFHELATSLNNEHQPTSGTERRLVDSMAQHFWLMQRAITLQDRLLTEPQLDHKSFSLYLRYQTTNERAYYKAMKELAHIRAEQRKLQNGFESQKRQQELQEAKIRALNAKSAATEIETEVRSTMEAPLPGHIRVPFQDLAAAFRITLQNLNQEFALELQKKAAA